MKETSNRFQVWIKANGINYPIQPWSKSFCFKLEFSYFCQILEVPNGPEPADWLGFDGWGRTWVCVFERDNSYLKLIRNEIHYEYVQLYILNRKFRNDKIGYLNPISKNLWPTNWKFKYGPLNQFKISTLLTWQNCNFFECEFSS